MKLTKDESPIACTIAKEGDFICPAMKFDAEPVCTIYTNDGVKARKRMGYCSFKSLRKPIVTVKKKKRTNPQKASKRKAKAGCYENVFGQA